MNGTITLVGSGEYLSPMNEVDAYLLSRLSDAPRVVCLPTAAGTEGPERIRYWSELGETHFRALGAEVKAVPVIDRQTANQPELAEQVWQANFVYLSGGKPGYLVQVLQDSLVWQAMVQVYRAGGVIAGCSAGAMIFGSRIPGFPLRSEAVPGFGYLENAVVIPHYDELPGTLAILMKGLFRHEIMVGIEGNTGLVCVDGGFEVMGKGGVTLSNSTGKKRYTQGEPVPAFTPTHPI